MAPKGKKRTAEPDSFRFQVGSKVLCRMGADEWCPGTVVQLNYRERDWPRGEVLPYQLELDDGDAVCVPEDNDNYCKELVLPWWHEVFFGREADHFEEPEAVAELAEAVSGQDINQSDYKGRTALQRAVGINWLDGVSELLHLKADVTITDKAGGSVLHRAIYTRDSVAMVRELCEGRADPNCQDKNPNFDPKFSSKTFGDRLQHRTPLHYACEEGQLEKVCALIELRADLNVQDGLFMTPLHLAIREADVSIIDILLRSRADANMGNMESGMNNSPLMGAALASDHDLARCLINARASVSQQGKQGMAAAHLAARRKDVEMLRLLVSARADLMQESSCGTALALAKKNGGAELLRTLGISEDEPQKSESEVRSVSSLDAAQRALLYMD